MPKTIVAVLLIVIMTSLSAKQVSGSAPLYVPSSHSAFYGPVSQLIQDDCFPCAPPDVQIAIGKGLDQDYAVEFVNAIGAIYPRNGGAGNAFLLSQIFQTGNNSIFDPKIFYDAASTRWYASVAECAGAGQCGTTTNGCTIVAVSNINDPRVGSWHAFPICFNDPRAGHRLVVLPDQPILGISSDKLMLSANFFNITSNGPPLQLVYLGAFWEVYNLNDLQNNHFTSQSYNGYGPYPNVESVHPLLDLAYDPSGIAWMVSTYGRDAFGQGSYNCNTSPYVTQVAVYKITGIPPTSSSSSYNVSLGPSNLRTPPKAQQEGTSVLIDTGDCRTLDAVFRNTDNVWLAADDYCVLAAVARSCFQLIQLDLTTSPGTLKQDFEVGYPNYYTFYPAIRVDSKGNLDVVFGYSSTMDYPSLAVAGQYFNDPKGYFTSDKVIKAGDSYDPQTPNDPCGCLRYGDYFGASLDTVDQRIWVAGETYQTNQQWTTYADIMTIA